jgi:hypothetical protein
LSPFAAFTQFLKEKSSPVSDRVAVNFRMQTASRPDWAVLLSGGIVWYSLCATPVLSLLVNSVAYTERILKDWGTTCRNRFICFQQTSVFLHLTSRIDVSEEHTVTWLLKIGIMEPKEISSATSTWRNSRGTAGSGGCADIATSWSTVAVENMWTFQGVLVVKEPPVSEKKGRWRQKLRNFYCWGP